MAIDLDTFHNNYFYEDSENVIKEYILKEIKNRQDKLAKKEEEIANLIYEKDLIKEDILNSIRNELNGSAWNAFRGFKPELLENAHRWGNHSKDKDYWSEWSKSKKKCEEHKKDCKTSFEFVNNFITQNILKNNPDYKYANEVLDWNYSTSYEFAYDIHGTRIWVSIPNFSNANEKNYKEILAGYAIRYKESEHVIELLVADLDYKKVADALENWINEKEKIE